MDRGRPGRRAGSCGLRWLRDYAGLLDRKGLCYHSCPQRDVFQFGSGRPVKATHRAYLPIGVGGTDFLIGTWALGLEIPLLASNRLLDALGMVLDLPNNRDRCHIVHHSAFA